MCDDAKARRPAGCRYADNPGPRVIGCTVNVRRQGCFMPLSVLAFSGIEITHFKKVSFFILQ